LVLRYGAGHLGDVSLKYMCARLFVVLSQAVPATW
jgi:hypothetical protein